MHTLRFVLRSRLSEVMLNGPSAGCQICKINQISEQKNICQTQIHFFYVIRLQRRVLDLDFGRLHSPIED